MNHAPRLVLAGTGVKGRIFKMDFVETILAGGNTLAIVIRGSINIPGISFFTPGNFSQQLAYMQHPAGKIIVPHVHNVVRREVTKTLEVLFVRKGRLRVDLYDDAKSYVESRILGPGDVILLVAGGHGFETLEPVEMFEVKQGPYAGDEDKAQIEGVPASRIQTVGAKK
jgi:mannose-6-phosphate isomerase-like protein (cupin superfamily)